MRLLTFFMFAAFLTANASGVSQTITISGKDMPLKRVFSVIKKQTGFFVLANRDLLADSKPVSLAVSNMPLVEFLAVLLRDQSLSYQMDDKTIFLSRKSPVVPDAPIASAFSDLLPPPPPVTFRVLDPEGKPLAGASFSSNTSKNKSARGVTDTEGRLSLNVSSGDRLLVSFVGFEPFSFVVTDEMLKAGSFSLRLTIDVNKLDETVVIGYGTVRKRDLTGAMTKVKGEIINEYAALSVSSALQGRVAGVQIGAINGQPGAGMQVRIRGANSIKGSNDPVWIINGAPGDINMINTSDIESVEVLKDASATAIYGSRGANGVVLITTKGAKSGKARMTYDGSVGVQSLANQIEMLTGDEYMRYLNMKAAINNRPAVYTDQQIADNKVNTNWQDEVFRKAMLQSHAIDISGGTDKMQGSFGLSYFNQDGIVTNSGYERLLLRTDLKYEVSKYITTSANIIYSRSNHDQMNSQGGGRGSSVIGGALVAPPTARPRYEDGSWNDFINEPTAGQNPVAHLNEISNKWYANRIVANAGVTVKPLKDVTVQLSANVRNTESRSDYFKSLKYPNSQGAASISIDESLYFTNNNIVTYDKGFGKHHLNVMGGVTYEASTSTPVGTGTAMGFLSDAVESYDLDAADVKGLPSSGYANWKLFSVLGRVNYNYDDRYLLTMSFRSDGSSRYSKGNKWGYFPSAAVAWRLSREEFLRSVNWLSDLKLRASYGKTGSTAISPYSTQNTLGSVNVVFNDDIVVGYAPANTYLGNLRWETTAQWNVGVDLSLFSNRLRLTSDYYYKKTTDLLNDVEMPRSSGYTTALRNIGSISNRGFEFELDSRIIDRSVKWDLGVNFSFNRSKVLALSEDKDIFGGTISNTIINDQLNLMRVGEPMYMFYGYVEEGYDANGQLVYKDLDGVAGISTADKAIIGNPNPDYLLNFNTSVRYKGFTLSAFLQGSIGNDIFSLSMATVAYDYGYNANAYREVFNNHWTPENPTAKYPNLLQTINLKMSDRFVYDGSYMRFKNLELGYDIPCKGSHTFKKARVYVSGQNLFTITSFPFWDPDINSGGGGNSMTQGVDASNYPSARTYTVGCRLAF